MCGKHDNTYGHGGPKENHLDAKGVGILAYFWKALRLHRNSSCNDFLLCLPVSGADFAQKRKSDQKRRRDLYLCFLESFSRGIVKEPQEL